MAYVSRYAHKRSVSRRSPEFLYLLVVLVAGVATAVWAARGIGPDLSVIQTAAGVLGINEKVGFNETVRQVGYSATSGAAPAPYCNPGQQAEFVNGIAALHQAIGNVMGTPVECEHPSSNKGDTVQQTSAGLAAYQELTNTVTFTDGWRHWALTPSGIVRWDGTDAYPPTAQSVPEDQNNQ